MELIHDKENRQYNLPLDNNLVASVMYTLHVNNHMRLVHSQVPIELRGKGVGRELVLKTFEKLTQEGYHATAICSYIKMIAMRHPKWSKIIQ